jgi:hypothetical protein
MFRGVVAPTVSMFGQNAVIFSVSRQCDRVQADWRGWVGLLWGAPLGWGVAVAAWEGWQSTQRGTAVILVPGRGLRLEMYSS